jgi:hypothetical protein
LAGAGGGTCARTWGGFVDNALAERPVGFVVHGEAGRHGSLRRLGHGGNGVGTLTPGTTGSTTRDGMVDENAIVAVAVPFGCVSLNDQIGCVPFGAAIVTRMREPARYAWPW